MQGASCTPCIARIGRIETSQPLQLMSDVDQHSQYWRKNLRVTGVLLVIWFVVTFVVGYFAPALNFTFFGWPFSFWVAGQGALLVYLAIIGFYAYYMKRLDRQFGIDTDVDA